MSLRRVISSFSNQNKQKSFLEIILQIIFILKSNIVSNVKNNKEEVELWFATRGQNIKKDLTIKWLNCLTVVFLFKHVLKIFSINFI